MCALALDRTRRFLHERLAIDLRSLAAFRMALGLVVLADLAIRVPDLVAFYGDDGILSRVDRLRYYGVGTRWSIWDLVADDPAPRLALFAITAVAAAMLVVGWRPRLAAVVCWVATQGLIARMPPIATGGDLLLAALLLWSAFLPLGARWSVDALRRPAEAPPPAAIVSLASAVILIQVVAMMALSGASKLRDPTWRAGDGVHYALHAEFYATPLAHALRELTGLLAPLTYAVLAFEIAGALLLVSPWRRDAARLAYAVGLAGLNLGFWLCLRVGIFSWGAIAAALLFVPGGAWDALARRRWLAAPAARLGAGVARWRGVPRRAPGWHRALRRPATALLAALAALAIYGNLHRSAQILPSVVYHAGRALALQQRGWPMFAPTARDHGWFVVPTTLADGRRIDLHEGGAPLDEGEPPLRATDFPSYRWRKLHFHMRRSGALRRLYLEYRCRAWNADHRGDEAAIAIELVYFRQRNLPGGARTPVERVSLHRARCGDRAAPAGPAAAEPSAADDAQDE